jgi:sugar phosphate isomerase/epimerase
VLDETDIGISTGAYSELSLGAALLRVAELAPRAEICSWRNHSLLVPVNARVVTAAGLPFTVHGPFTHNDFASSSKARHKVALEVHERHMTAAAELGAELYVVHPDLSPRPVPWNRKLVAELQRSFERLRELQDELGMPVAVENMPGLRQSHFTAPGDLDLRGLGLVLDVGHATLTGTLSRFVNEHDGELRHLHLHDNGGRATGDRHAALGSGVVDFAPALREARAVGATIVLEHMREADVLGSLRHLREAGLLTPAAAAAAAPDTDGQSVS